VSGAGRAVGGEASGPVGARSVWLQGTGSAGLQGAAFAGPDLRLAGLAVAAWLAALAVLYGGAALGVGLTVAAGVGALILAYTRTVGTRRHEVGRQALGRVALGGAALGVLLGVVAGSAATAARVATRDAPAITELARQRAPVRADLTVRDDPRPARRDAGRPPLYVVRADLHRLTPLDGVALLLDARVLRLATDPAWRTVLPGQSLTAAGRLALPRGADLTAAVLNVTGAPERAEPAPWHQRAAGALRAGLQRACAPLPDDPGGLLPGLVVGDTSALPSHVEDDFRATGMTHLTAVSGSNVAIVVGAVLLLARFGRAGPRLAAALGVAALIGFVILVRPSPSVLRAGVMGGLGLLALASARQRAAVPALCATVAVLVLVDPALAGDAGFALSVLATAGLLLLAPRWRDALRRRGVPRGVAEALAVPAAAQFACSPVIAALSGSVSLVAVPANLLVVPAVAPATVLGVVAAVLSPIWPGGAEAVAWLGQWPARWLVVVARYGADIPGGAIPWPPGAFGGLLLAGVLLGLLFAVRSPAVRRFVAVVSAAAMLGSLPVRILAGGWPPAGWVVVACAVGQGDTVVLSVAPGRAVIVDAGPEPAAADRCLRRLGITTVPLLVVTHFHADHVAGLPGVFRGREVGTVIVPAWPEPAAGRAQALETADAYGVPVREVTAGWRYAEGDLALTALGPPWPIAGTRSDPNNNSLILRAQVRKVSVLLAGDAETEEQEALLQSHDPAVLRSDVLKVAHHGSAYQSERFLDVVAPRVALVCVGADNPYGHPSPAVVERLTRRGTRVLRTDTAGDTAATITDGRLAVVTAGSATSP